MRHIAEISPVEVVEYRPDIPNPHPAVVNGFASAGKFNTMAALATGWFCYTEKRDGERGKVNR